MNATIIVFIVFGSLTTVAILIGLIVYFGKRLEHKQILAAIEKGTPLSELRPVKPKPVGPIWVKYLSSGVLILAIGLAFIVAGPMMGPGSPMLFVGIILCGVGIASLIRGLLYRKYQLKSQLSANSNTVENRNTPGVSAPETVRPTNE